MSDQETIEPKKVDPPKPKPKMVTVKVISVDDESALVERVKGDDLIRVLIKRSALIGTQVDQETLNNGAPYGIDWEEVIEVPENPRKLIAQALRKSGIWTGEDLEHNPRAAQKAVRLASSGVLSSLLKAARGG